MGLSGWRRGKSLVKTFWIECGLQQKSRNHCCSFFVKHPLSFFFIFIYGSHPQMLRLSSAFEKTIIRRGAVCWGDRRALTDSFRCFSRSCFQRFIPVHYLPSLYLYFLIKLVAPTNIYWTFRIKFRFKILSPEGVNILPKIILQDLAIRLGVRSGFCEVVCFNVLFVP